MNFLELRENLSLDVIGEDVPVSRMAKIQEACEGSSDLMVGICSGEQNSFCYCNRKLRDSMGANALKLLLHGWSFWFSTIDSGEVLAVKKKINVFLRSADGKVPLILNYHVSSSKGQRICLRHEICLYHVEGQRIAINYWFDLTDKKRIERYVELSDPGDLRPLDRGGLNISSREEEVLRLIANGFSSKEIADILFISHHTAISHRKNLIEKFQVRNTAHLVKKAAEFICLEPFL